MNLGGKTMERLTMIDGLGNKDLAACLACHAPGNDNENCGMCAKFEEMVNRLSAYEDTGLLPEEIEKIKDAAEKTKRLQTVTRHGVVIRGKPETSMNLIAHHYGKRVSVDGATGDIFDANGQYLCNIKG